MLIIEVIIEHIAKKLGKTPEDKKYKLLWKR